MGLEFDLPEKVVSGLLPKVAEWLKAAQCRGTRQPYLTELGTGGTVMGSWPSEK